MRPFGEQLYQYWAYLYSFEVTYYAESKYGKQMLELQFFSKENEN